MSVPVIQVGNIGTVFQFEVLDQDLVGVVLTAATLLDILFYKPDRTTIVRGGVLTTDGTDFLYEYVSVAGDLNQAGDRWRKQGHVIVPGLGEFWTNVLDFSVKGNLI